MVSMIDRTFWVVSMVVVALTVWYASPWIAVLVGVAVIFLIALYNLLFGNVEISETIRRLEDFPPENFREVVENHSGYKIEAIFVESVGWQLRVNDIDMCEVYPSWEIAIETAKKKIDSFEEKWEKLKRGEAEDLYS